MIQIIAAIVVAVWFFRSARTVGKSGFGWAIIGAFALFVPSIPWAIFARAAILPALIDSDIGEAGAIISGLAIGLVGVGLGLVVAFWVHRKNLKSSVQQSDQQSVQQGDQQDALINASATVIVYKQKGWLDNVIDDDGAITGFWLAHPQPNETERAFLRMAAANEKVDEASYISISLGDYRIVENNEDSKGGVFIMFGGAKAPNEVIPPLDTFTWKKGKPNPKSDNVLMFKEGIEGVRFSCPTCGLPNYCFFNDLNVESGALVACGHCGNISHVPGDFKTKTCPSDLIVNGCVYMSIDNFSDWFYAHPHFSSDNAEIYGSYGLWAFCAKCKHQYSSTVLPMFPISDQAGGFMFNARTQESADDMNGLINRSCPSCGTSHLLSLMIPIPERIMTTINERRS